MKCILSVRFDEVAFPGKGSGTTDNNALPVFVMSYSVMED
ncbi:MAG: hypothetical protein K0S61_4545 [Anaerocolumna sp.]|nr:hypothetical protein [Anaerocolumna sp.]